MPGTDESRIVRLEVNQETTKGEVKVIRSEFNNLREDVRELTGTVNNRLKSVSLALWAGFTVFLTAFLTLVGMILAGGLGR